MIRNVYILKVLVPITAYLNQDEHRWRLQKEDERLIDFVEVFETEEAAKGYAELVGVRSENYKIELTPVWNAREVKQAKKKQSQWLTEGSDAKVST